MASGRFEEAREKVIREHKRSIVKSALNGYERRGRGLVLLELGDSGEMEHLSYLTLDKLKHRKGTINLHDQSSGVLLVEKISSYSPNSEVLVVVTDGEYERFMVGSKQAAY